LIRDYTSSTYMVETSFRHHKCFWHPWLRHAIEVAHPEIWSSKPEHVSFGDEFKEDAVIRNVVSKSEISCDDVVDGTPVPVMAVSNPNMT
jgi:hypothetical protein